MTVLVAYASKHGGTQGIAEAIGRSLTTEGVANEVRAVDQVETLAGYDAVVLGSAVYMGRWMDAALRFVDAHQATLTGRPVWLFSSGPLGDPPHPTEEHAVEVAEVAAATTAREHRLFTGRLDKHHLNFGERAVVVAVRAPDGDFRDWDEIAEWAHEIARGVGG
mgnify:CR=1 FL=1